MPGRSKLVMPMRYKGYRRNIRVSHSGVRPRYYSRSRRPFSRPIIRELKFFDFVTDDATIAVGGSIISSVNLIGQGVLDSERIGRKCTIRKIGWRFTISLDISSSASATNFDIVRVIMYLDKQCNGAAAVTLDILELNDFQSFNNLSNSGRFRTLMDRTYDMNAKAGAGDGATNDFAGMSISDTFWKDVNIPLEFSESGLTGVRSNNIGVLLVSSTGISGFDGIVRLRFSDS